MLIAQLTDLHCTGTGPAQPFHRRNDERAAGAVTGVLGEDPAPDMVLATGDLTCDGHPEHLAGLLRTVTSLGERFLPLPGNHDDPAALRAAFGHMPWADGHASWSLPVGNDAHLIGLDSTAPGYHGGSFDAVREDWLRGALAAAGAPVLLALHHPPFPTGIAWMDLPFRGVERLAACVRQSPVRIAKIVCGHFHRPVVGAFAGIPVQVGLATATHVALDLRAEAGPAIVDEPIGYQLHWWNGADWVTHTRYVGAAGPEPAPWL